MLHQRLVLAGAAAILALTRQANAASSLALSECVEACVASSGCESKDTKCVCKAAKDGFLETVVTCLYYHCKDDLRNVDSLFLNPVKSGCEADKKAIPKKEIDEAKKVASSLVAKLPKTTTTVSRPLPVPTQTKPTVTTTKGTKPASSSSSTFTSSSEPTTSSAAFIPPPPTTVTPVPESSTTTAQGGPQGVPTDSSPFATIDSPGSRPNVPWLMQSLLFLAPLAFR
ncbi:hypothetical protein B0T16DRAFT_398379 [Cercophora newfieldiana]|uniref:Extracellular membrane protein CFEM domain-containing protein n=1 Tax=Cercophora newfieldiana TaxID=92897 RepID=A0AA39YNY0_9PEZI|nr:hypothetical protein B0T16DRAFT_398379 [Cercophora newfieldiana]